MNIIFMGTPEFAVPALEALHKAGYEIPLVFTQPDKPRDRGHKISFSPVKEYAIANGLDVFQPQSLRRGEDSEKSLELIKQINPDVIIVAAYGQILPKEVLELPRLGCVNIHASLLPRWRGAAPINFCIMKGDAESGITIMQMEEGIDTGDMFISKSCKINDTTTASELHDELKLMGAELIVKFMENPEYYIKNKTEQNNDEATYAPMITKEMKRIKLNESAIEIRNHIRGLSGQAYAYYNNKRLKIFSSEILSGQNEYNKNGLDIICGDGKMLRLTEIQLEGKNKMNAEDFLRGFNKDKMGVII